MKIFSKKKLCLVCGCVCDDDYTTIEYRYEGDKTGAVYMCKGCTEKQEFVELDQENDDE